MANTSKSPVERLEAFFKGQKNKAVEGDPLAACVLLHGKGDKLDDLRRIDEWDMQQDETEILARDVFSAVNEDVQAFASPQRYVVALFVESNLSVPRATYTLRAGSSEAHVDEQPTERGLIGQMMRHTEASQRIAYEAHDRATKHLVKTVELLSGRLEKHERNSIDLFDAREAAMLERVRVQFDELERLAEEEGGEVSGQDIKALLFENLKEVVPTALPQIFANIIGMFQAKKAKNVREMVAVLEPSERAELLKLLGGQPQIGPGAGSPRPDGPGPGPGPGSDLRALIDGNREERKAKRRRVRAEAAGGPAPDSPRDAPDGQGPLGGQAGEAVPHRGSVDDPDDDAAVPG